jgi:hypothetical protein
MIGRLTHLIATTADDDQATALKAAFLRTQNERGELDRPAAGGPRCQQQGGLMAVDPELACIPHEDGASPLYVAINTSPLRQDKSKGKLSYCGSDGRNVLHAAVPRGQGMRIKSMLYK